MKAYGDFPIEHVTLLRELELLENWFNEYGDTISALSASKGFTCMAHDYYMMDVEEEGDRLLMRAENSSPGYFKGPILVHIEKDKDFAILTSNLKKTMGLDIMIAFGFDNEQN